MHAVIWVNAEHTLDGDNLESSFCREFYRCISTGETIQSAFTLSMNKLEEKGLKFPICCCFHSHLSTCPWILNHVNPEGLQNAHLKHVPLCNCPDRNQSIHQYNCAWKKEFESRVMRLQNGIIEETSMGSSMEDSIAREKPRSQKRFKDCRYCCCRPELNHDYSMKVSISYKDGDRSIGRHTVFDLKRSDELTPNRGTGRRRFSEISTLENSPIGREKLIYQIYNSFVGQKRKIITVFGQRHSGKTFMSQAIANLMLERNHVTDVKLINMDKSDNLNSIFSRISKSTHSVDQANFLSNIPRDSSELIVIMGLNSMLGTKSEEFLSTIKDIVDVSKYRFLLLINGSHHVGKFESLQNTQEIFHLNSLNVQKAARLIDILTYSRFIGPSFTLQDLMLHPVMRVKKSQPLNPNKIVDIAQMLNNGRSLDEIASKYERDASEVLDGQTTRASSIRRHVLLMKYVVITPASCG